MHGVKCAMLKDPQHGGAATPPCGKDANRRIRGGRGPDSGCCDDCASSMLRGAIPWSPEELDGDYPPVVAMRAGDTVKHRPSGERWILAWGDVERGEVSACGWPESVAAMSDCTLVRACTDAEHIKMLREWALKNREGHRVIVCRRQLAALGGHVPAE